MTDQLSQVKLVGSDKFGERLKHFRKKMGLNQKNFGKSLGVSLATITRLERGVFKPQGDFLTKLVNIYDCDIKWLLTGVEEEINNLDSGFKDVIRDQHIYDHLKSLKEMLKEVLNDGAFGGDELNTNVQGLRDRIQYLNALLQVGKENMYKESDD